jgi:hypothetical protein
MHINHGGLGKDVHTPGPFRGLPSNPSSHWQGGIEHGQHMHLLKHDMELHTYINYYISYENFRKWSMMLAQSIR